MRFHLPALFLLSISLFNNIYAQVGQERTAQDQAQEKLFDGLNSVLVDDFKARAQQLTQFHSLTNEFSSVEDQKTYQELVSQLGTQGSFTRGRLDNGYYRLRVESVEISVPMVNLITSTISFNDQTFTLKEGENYAQMLQRLRVFLDTEVLPLYYRNRTSSHWLDWLIPQAHANASAQDRERFRTILEVNATGAVYLSLSVWQIWRKDAETFQKLLSVVEKDMQDVNRTCRDLKDKVGVKDHNNGVRVFGMLNDNTAQTLERLSSNDKVDSRLVLRSALARYAKNSGHTHKDDGAVDCRQFFGSVTSMMGGTIKMEIDQTCQAFDQAVSCLDDLKSSHDKVYSVGRNQQLKLYNGNRPYVDHNEDAFRGLSSPRGTSR